MFWASKQKKKLKDRLAKIETSYADLLQCSNDLLALAEAEEGSPVIDSERKLFKPNGREEL